ncbi:MAG: nuclear transport factor 2 family protein [Pseudomonadota bacterium]
MFEKHADAFLRGDIDGVMADFDSRSVVITPDGVFDDLAAIRALYTALLDEFGSVMEGDSSFELDNRHVKGNLLWVQWHAETSRNRYPFATDTFLIENGCIHRQTITPLVEPKT